MEKINWINNSQPALNATNLNRMQQNIEEAIDEKQDTLVSSENIKTINNQTILGSGNINVEATINVNNTYSTSTTDTYSCNYINGIIESGSNSNGEWVKYADGTMICTQTINLDVSVSNTWGSWYYWTEDRNTYHSFPQTFTRVDGFSMEIFESSNRNGFMLADYGRRLVELSRWSGICLIRPTSNQVECVLKITAIGKWN